MRNIVKLLGCLFGCLVAFGNSFALDVAVPTGFVTRAFNVNAGGGFAYLPDGDILALTSDYAKGPALVRYDLNGDGIPAGGSKVLKQFASTVFGSFVQVSPNGEFAVFGVSGSSSSVYRITVADESIKELFQVAGNFDFTFTDNEHGYLSANPDLFNPMGANFVYHVTLAEPSVVTPVISILGVPSGPVTVNERGDLYYIEGTYTPGEKSTLLRFNKELLSEAVKTGGQLNRADASLSMQVEPGYDLVFQREHNGKPYLFYSTTFGNQIYRMSEAELSAEPFVTLTDSPNPSATVLAVYRPMGSFNAEGLSTSKLAVVATDFGSKNAVVEIEPSLFDSDEDGTSATDDACPLDPAKSVAGVCGCGKQDVDSNGDNVVDCGAPAPFSKTVQPRVGSIEIEGKTVRITFEKFPGSGISYEVTVRRVGKSDTTTLTTRKNRVTLKGLKRGQYQVVVRAVKRSGGKQVRSRAGERVRFSVE